MPFPKFPTEMTEAGWKQATGKNYAQLEKESKFGSTLAVMEEVMTEADEKAFNELEKAIKSSEGGAIQSNYALVDAAFVRIERLARLAKEHDKLCKEFAPDYKKVPATKPAGEWLLKSGAASVKYCETLTALGEELLEEAEKVPQEKITDLNWDLNEWDLTHLLTKVLQIKLDSIKLPDKKPVLVTVTGKVGAEAASNATLRAEFFEAAYDAAKKAAPTLKAELEDVDERFNSGAIKGNDLPKLMDAAFGRFETVYAKQADVAIQKIWTELAKDKSEYASYKLKVAVSIGAKVGGIGVGVATIVTTGWTGAGTVVGILALLKSSIDLVTKIREGLLEARDMAKAIAKELQELKDAYAKDSSSIVGVKEVAKDVVARLTSLQISSVKSVKESAATYGSKIQGCNVNSTAMGAEIDKLLKEADALAIKIEKAKVQLKNVKGVNFAKLGSKHDQVMVEVNKLVSSAADYKEDYKKGKQLMVTWVQQIKDLEGTVPEIAQRVQKWVVPLVDFAYVTDVEGVITKTGSLAREYLTIATETEDELKQANEVGDLAGDVTVLIVGLIGKH